MPVTYKRAPEVAAIAKDLIYQYHAHIVGFRIEYLFGSEAPESNGVITRGLAKKISGVNAALACEDVVTDFFCMIIFEDEWRLMSAQHQCALVDHELCHFRTTIKDDGSVKLWIAEHDLEEFSEIIERHGFWKKAVDSMFRSMVKGQSILQLDDYPRPPLENVDMTIEYQGKEIKTTLKDLREVELRAAEGLRRG